MSNDIDDWIKRVDAVRPAMIDVAMRLRQPGVIVGRNVRLQGLCDSIPFVATFLYDGGVKVTICFQFMDRQTKSDVVITNMTTLPREARSHGFGSRAVQTFLEWAKENNLHEIRATQAGDPDSHRFWLKNGFVQAPDPNPCRDCVFTQ
jgi:GNAT superfamily N-acetyltransferase